MVTNILEAPKSDGEAPQEILEAPEFFKRDNWDKGQCIFFLLRKRESVYMNIDMNIYTIHI